MPNNTYDIFLRFLLDKSAQTQTEAGVKSLNKSLEQTEQHVHDINQAGHDAGLVRAMDESAKAVKEKLNPALVDAVKHQKELAAAAKHAAHEAHLQMQVFDSQAMILSARASQMTKQASELTRISSRLGQFSRIGLVTGGAVVGGIFAEANRFAKEAEDTGKATKATQAWTKATEDLARARARVDTVLLRESLPLLQQAAKVANQAASFVEKHPQIVEAALKTGAVVAGLGAIGIAVSKGIQLKADQLYLAAVPIQLRAAELQMAAAEQMLVAAQLQAEAHGAELATSAGKTPASGLAAGLNSPLGIAALVVGATAASIKAADALKQLEDRLTQIGGPAAKPFITFLDTVTRFVNPLVPAIKDFRTALERDVPAILKFLGMASGTQAPGATGSIGGRTPVTSSIRSTPEQMEGVARAFIDFRADEERAQAEAAQQRAKIVSNSEKQIAAETKKYNKEVESINSSATKRAMSIADNYRKQSAKDEAHYQEQRAKIIRDGGQEIRDIEAEHQERLRKLTMEHNDRVEELTASRDALGLAKEARRFNQDQAEEARSTRQEIAKRREDLAERLAELDQEHQVEQAQRLAQFQEDLAENEAQRKERLQQAAEAHAEQMSQLRVQRAEQLRDLQEGLNAERIRRREQFIAQIRDLDAALLGERTTKVKYYNQMYQDAVFWLNNMRRLFQAAPTATAPAHDYTGYAYTGMYRMAANGQPEYVLSGAATRAAENLIGGGLSENALLTALARGGGTRSVTINDHSRFDGRISASQVRSIKRETVGAVLQELSNA